MRNKFVAAVVTVLMCVVVASICLAPVTGIVAIWADGTAYGETWTKIFGTNAVLAFVSIVVLFLSAVVLS